MEKVTGVNWHKGRGKWRAAIKVKGKTHHLGSFDNHSDAVKARKEAEEKYGIEKARRLDDLEGERFGKFTVIGDTGKRTNSHGKVLLCRRDDGTIREIVKSNLLNGTSKGVGAGKNNPAGKIGERHITTEKNGKYIVRKRINGKHEYFGTFNTLPEAIAKRDEILLLIEQGKL